jgi:hypothetical protein
MTSNGTPGENIPVEIQTATRERDGKPFVKFTLGGKSVLMDVDEARSLGTLILEFAAIAEQDGLLVRASVGLGLNPQDLVEAVQAERKRTKGRIH